MVLSLRFFILTVISLFYLSMLSMELDEIFNPKIRISDSNKKLYEKMRFYIERNHQLGLKKFLEENPHLDLNIFSEKLNPLVCAIDNNKITMAKWLIEKHGVKLTGYGLLKVKSLEMVKMLNEKKANWGSAVFAKDSHNVIPLLVLLFERLSEHKSSHKVDINIIKFNRVKKMVMLIIATQTIDLNLKFFIDGRQYSLLESAKETGDKEIIDLIKCLIEAEKHREVTAFNVTS